MRFRVGGFLLAAGLWFCAGARAQVPRDVPSGHWARSAVLAVTGRGVMSAPGGKFGGTRAVTRTELATALANLARSLEQGKWPKTETVPLAKAPAGARLDRQTVTRYELAVVLYRTAQYVMQGLPKRAGKTFGNSVILPAPFKPKGVPSSNPAYESLSYLAKNRMIWPDSPLLKPGRQPVTGAQTADAVAQMVIGLNDRLTDEPQLREDLGEPPGKR
jgi:hypothetical protein